MLPGVDVPASGQLAALFRVPIDYVLELRVDGKVASAVSVPNYPGGLSIEQPHASIVRHTLGDEPVRELTANRTWMITVRGNSGWAERAGYNGLGHVIFAPGTVIVREFQDFLNAYQEKAAEHPTRTDLVFRAFGEQLNYRCEVESWSIDRDAARSPHTWDWALRLKGYAPAAPNKPLNLLSPVAEAFETATAKVQLANAYIAQAGNAVANLRGDLERLRAPLLALQQTGQALGKVTQSAREIARFPASVVADFANAARIYKDVWEDLVGSQFDDPLGVNGLSALSGEWELLKTRLGYPAEDAAQDAVTMLGLSGGGAGDLDSAESRALVVGPLSGFGSQPAPRDRRRDAPRATPVQLHAGESLRDVASRVLGDAEQWSVIAEYNGWQNAHRLGSGRPARRGDVVQVPVLAVDPVVSPPDTDPFLRDFFLTEDGDLELTPDGDLRTVRGVPNLRQALAGRLLTERGTSAGFPAYGLPPLVGSGISLGMRAYFAAHMREQLLRDPRVESVASLEVVDDGDTFFAQAEVAPLSAAGQPLTVLAPIPAAP